MGLQPPARAERSPAPVLAEHLAGSGGRLVRFVARPDASVGRNRARQLGRPRFRHRAGVCRDRVRTVGPRSARHDVERDSNGARRARAAHERSVCDHAPSDLHRRACNVVGHRDGLRFRVVDGAARRGSRRFVVQNAGRREFDARDLRRAIRRLSPPRSRTAAAPLGVGFRRSVRQASPEEGRLLEPKFPVKRGGFWRSEAAPVSFVIGAAQ